MKDIVAVLFVVGTIACAWTGAKYRNDYVIWIALFLCIGACSVAGVS